MEKFLPKIYNLIQTFQAFITATPFRVIFMISRSVNHQEGHQSPKFYNIPLSFVGLTTLKTLIGWFNKLSVQKIQPLIVIYRRDNIIIGDVHKFVYNMGIFLRVIPNVLL